MFEATAHKPPTYEPRLNETIKIDGKQFKCFLQIEDMQADGSYCSGCDFFTVYPTKGQLISDCTASAAVYLVCSASDRNDNENVTFTEVS